MIFIFGQVTQNKYIVYLIFVCGEWSENEYVQYLCSLKSFMKTFYLYALANRQWKLIMYYKYATNLLEKWLYGGRWFIQSLNCIYLIFVFVHGDRNQYIQYFYLVRNLGYSYSVKLLGTNIIFNIRIWSAWGQRIYSIFVFGQKSGYEYIQYSYSVKPKT